MKPSDLQILKIDPHATLPSRAHADDAGLDLYATHDVSIPPHSHAMIKTGIAIALPPQTVGMILDRSSLAKKGLKTAGGVIDAGYTGEIIVILWNISTTTLSIVKNEKIAQIVIFPILTPIPKLVTSLETTARGPSGFGSTGAF